MFVEAHGLMDEGLDELRGEDLDSVSDQCLDADVVELARLRDRLEAEWLRRVREWQLRGVWAADGSRSAPAALARRCGLSSSTAHDKLAVAGRLAEAPVVADAFATGSLSFAKARVLTTAVAEDEAEANKAKFAAAEAELVELCRPLSVQRVGFVMRHWHAGADPDGHAAAYEKLYERRRVHLSQSFEGWWHLDGFLDPEGGQALAHVIDVLSSRAWRADHREAAEAGESAEGPRRTAAQRRADAVVALAHGALDCDRDSADAKADAMEPRSVTRPVIAAVVDLDHQGNIEAATLAHTGEPLPIDAAERLRCDASVARVVVRGASAPLDVGRATPTVTTAILRALIIRDGGCTIPGCGMPARYCHAHHIVYWQRDGTTGLWNLVLVCGFHHRLAHREKWRCSLDPVTGRPRWTNADGIELTPDPTLRDLARTARTLAA